jgi:hypothetical protein
MAPAAAGIHGGMVSPSFRGRTKIEPTRASLVSKGLVNYPPSPFEKEEYGDAVLQRDRRGDR